MTCYAEITRPLRGHYALSRCRYSCFAVTRDFLVRVRVHVRVQAWARAHVGTWSSAVIHFSPSRNHRVTAKHE
jgi:hypothetical protein